MAYSPNNDSLLGRTAYFAVAQKCYSPFPREMGARTGIGGTAWRITAIDPRSNRMTLHTVEHWKASECKLDAFLRYVKAGDIILE
jgi:hypothetical protein